MTTYTYTANGTVTDGAANAKAVITVSGDTVTVQLTDLTPNATSDGQAISSIQLKFASTPGSPSNFTQAGSLVDLANIGTKHHPDQIWESVSGSPNHWAASKSGNSILLTTLSGGKPDDLILDTDAGASNANASVTQHDPHISDTATFTFTFSGPPPAITGVVFGFGTTAGCDTLTGTLVTCFIAGTRIAVSATETVDIETLKAGDLVLTHDGREVPVLWVGRQTVSRRFADPGRVLPIRIAAGALAAGLPERDLLVSPCHALLIDGVLVQAGALVNGASITVETGAAETFVYYHVETEDHSLILAEGVPAETFIDNVGRMAFDNWNEHEALFPKGREMTELDYPRVTSARQLPAAIALRLAGLSAAA